MIIHLLMLDLKSPEQFQEAAGGLSFSVSLPLYSVGYRGLTPLSEEGRHTGHGKQEKSFT